MSRISKRIQAVSLKKSTEHEGKNKVLNVIYEFEEINIYSTNKIIPSWTNKVTPE